jgi:pyridoxine 4-dehydrogenase
MAVTADSALPPEQRRLGAFLVAPIGFGAMQLTGPGVFGPPADRSEALLLLREVVDSGVRHIDTAQFYGPDVVNELIFEALYPYPTDLVLVSKVGARRDKRGGIFAYDEPAQLRRGIEENLRALGLDSLAVVNLRLMRGRDPDAYFDDQLDAMIGARDDGLIGAIGLSNVSLEQLVSALRSTDIVCVQNPYHLANRRSQPVLDECSRRGIAFVPFAPLGSGADSVLGLPHVRQVAERLGCTRAQVAIAWALHAAPNVLLIPGTSSRRHFRENLAASEVHLDADALQTLRSIGARSAGGYAPFNAGEPE